MPILALKQILVALDPTESDMSPLVAAADLATAAGAMLHVVSVADSDGPHTAEQLPPEVANRIRHVGRLQRDATVHSLTGEPSRAIASLADRVRASVIVLGKHRDEASTALGIGGTAMAVVTNASCPCLVVKSRLRLPLDHVLVPVDSSDTARGALLVGLSWASALRQTTHAGGDGASLTALHIAVNATPGAPVPTPVSVEREIRIAREAGGNWAGVMIREVTVAAQSAASGIATFTHDHDPDLVVMGTRGLGLDAIGRLGSVTAATAKMIDASLLLVPPAMWLSVSATRCP